MPLTRRQRADMNSRYDGWTPEEEYYFIRKLFHAARGDLVEPGSYRRYRLEGHLYYRKLRYIFEWKRCAVFPRSILGSHAYPSPDHVDDENVLVVDPIGVYEETNEYEAAASPPEDGNEASQVNDLAVVPYEGGRIGAENDGNRSVGFGSEDED